MIGLKRKNSVKRVPAEHIIIINGHPIERNLFTDTDIIHIYESIRRSMERENDLINYRIQWMLLITAGFITAQAFIAGSVIRELAQQNAAALQGVACLLMAMMSAAALFSTLRTQNAVEAAHRQLSYLKYYYLRSEAGGKDLFEYYFHLPRPFGDPSAHKSGNKGSRAFPPMIVGLWLVLCVMQTIAGIVYITVAAESSIFASASPARPSSDGTAPAQAGGIHVDDARSPPTVSKR